MVDSCVDRQFQAHAAQKLSVLPPYLPITAQSGTGQREPDAKNGRIVAVFQSPRIAGLVAGLSFQCNPSPACILVDQTLHCLDNQLRKRVFLCRPIGARRLVWQGLNRRQKLDHLLVGQDVEVILGLFSRCIEQINRGGARQQPWPGLEPGVGFLVRQQ